MKKSRIGGFVAIAVGVIVALGFFSPNQNEKEILGYHVTLADPNLYENGIFVDTFEIQEGIYEFQFVPNGDSPQKISINLIGESVSFFEDFQLEGTPNETGISVYYTWDYLGKKELKIVGSQQVEIEVNPHGNLLGPVSIDLVPKN